MSPESFFKEYNVFHIIAINERDESSCIVTVDPSLVGRDHIDVALDVSKEKLEDLRVLEVSEQARTSAQRFLKAFQKDSCDKIEKALENSYKQSHKGPVPFFIGDTVKILKGEGKGKVGLVTGFLSDNSLTVKVREGGSIYNLNIFDLNDIETAQDICKQLNKV